MIHRLCLLLLLLGTMGIGCSNANLTGASGAIDEPILDVTGTWTGVWGSDDPLRDRGTLSIVLVQIEDKEVVVESSTINGSPTCYDTGFGQAKVKFASMSGLIVDDPQMPADPGPPRIPRKLAKRFLVDVAVLGLEMSGTYTVVAHPVPSCRRDVGTLSLTRP